MVVRTLYRSAGLFRDGDIVYGYRYENFQRSAEARFSGCSHAIGDRANREILDRYEIAFKENPALSSDHRFRIEHAQHLHPYDIPRFGKLGVIPQCRPFICRLIGLGRSKGWGNKE